MKKTRFAAALLCTLLASQVLASCGDTAEEQPKDTTPVNTEPVTEASTDILDDLGDISFEGQTFTMYFAYPVGGYIMEEETGDVLDDATYARNRAVEERLGITLDYNKAGTGTTGSDQAAMSATLRSLIMAGDDTNDVYVHVQHGAMPGMIADGLFLDWNEVPNIDFTKPYWYQRCLDDINYYDKVFGMTGAYNRDSMSVANCLYFNKRILSELDIDYPYQDVLDGKWTVDKFYEIVEESTSDLNGDGVIDADNDRLGFWGWGYEQIPAFFMGLGGDIVYKDKDGAPVLNVNNDRTARLIEAMQKTFQLPGAKTEYSTWGIFNTKFINGELTFVHGGLSFATSLRDMQDDFGFVPYPKLDEAQEGYVSRVQNTSSLTYIPITNENLAFTGACLEVMASYSYNMVLPVYFDIVLTVKTTRDTESEQMIPLIRESCSFYDEAAGGFDIRSAVLGNTGFSSYWASVESKVTENVQKNIIDVYSD